MNKQAQTGQFAAVNILTEEDKINRKIGNKLEKLQDQLDELVSLFKLKKDIHAIETLVEISNIMSSFQEDTVGY